jgi:CheY-like chemotaxis protein
MGDEEEALKGLIPDHVLQDSFPRPIDMGQAVRKIDEYIKKFGRHCKKKILVVDDSGAMLRNLKEWLEDKYQVILANSGAMAIKYLATNRPDLVLLDYEMPVVDGRQVLEMIRTETEFCDVPVIFLTSKNDKESIMKVMALKPEGYLLKSLKPEQIIQEINTFFEKRKRL